jgi:hypothetical protein
MALVLYGLYGYYSEHFASVQALHGLSRLPAWWVALGIDLERGPTGASAR